jgi:hypothetical protein
MLADCSFASWAAATPNDKAKSDATYRWLD